MLYDLQYFNKCTIQYFFDKKNQNDFRRHKSITLLSIR